MTYHDLYDLTPRAFWNAVDGFWLQKENEDRKEWERARWTTCCLINVQLPRNKQLSVQKLVRFSWESEEADVDTYEETARVYQDFLKKKNTR